MSKYIKKQNNIIVQAPFEKIIKNNVKIYGYNSQNNEKTLFKDGYLKYNGKLPLSCLDIVNGNIIEITPIDPTDPSEKIFTKLQIRRAMRSLGVEQLLDMALASNKKFASDWNDAQDINLNDVVFKQALKQLGITEQMLNKIIEQIKKQ